VVVESVPSPEFVSVTAAFASGEPDELATVIARVSESPTFSRELVGLMDAAMGVESTTVGIVWTAADP
jgi:hypothetical protein